MRVLENVDIAVGGGLGRLSEERNVHKDRYWYVHVSFKKLFFQARLNARESLMKDKMKRTNFTVHQNIERTLGNLKRPFISKTQVIHFRDIRSVK